MKDKIIEIITKHTPETTYIDGANAADEILALLDVSGMFSEEQMGAAYWDGREHEESGGGCFDIENYR